MKKVIKNDTVIVIAGNDKGKVGKVLSVQGERLLVEGVNVRKKCVRPNPQLQIEGGIVDKALPIHCSNVAIYNPETQKADRVGVRAIEPVPEVGPKRERFYKSNGATIENRGR